MEKFAKWYVRKHWLTITVTFLIFLSLFLMFFGVKYDIELLVRIGSIIIISLLVLGLYFGFLNLISSHFKEAKKDYEKETKK